MLAVVGASLYYEGRGTSGLPLVLVHGFPLDHAMWRGQLDGLSREARVVALDLPGFGRSPPLSNGSTPVTMEQLADQVVSLADALGFQKFVLGGLSMGGYVAMAVSRRHLARLAGLILVDTRAEPDTDEGKSSRLLAAKQVLTSGLSTLVEESPKKLLAPDSQRNCALVRKVEHMIWRSSWAGVAGTLRGMAERPDARPDLARLRIPTIVIVGEQDVITPPQGAQKLAASIPQAELVVIAGAGHLSPLEAPRAVNSTIRAFLGRLSA
ncbi:MAG: alpha/beta fold hydrolase [Deltaproteobacteria bacterium]|nr:alpha/beta fold hydrolase [Deltaproteobacteria bacterium]